MYFLIKLNIKKILIVLYIYIILAGINAEGEIYGNFKLLVKRNPKENNFKAILGSI